MLKYNDDRIMKLRKAKMNSTDFSYTVTFSIFNAQMLYQCDSIAASLLKKVVNDDLMLALSPHLSSMTFMAVFLLIA